MQNWVRSLRPFIPIRKNESGYNELWDDAVQILYLVHTLHREKGYSIKQIEKFFTTHKDEFIPSHDKEPSKTDRSGAERQDETMETEENPLSEANSQEEAAEPPVESNQEVAASWQHADLVTAIIELTKSLNHLTTEVEKLSAREKADNSELVTETAGMHVYAPSLDAQKHIQEFKSDALF
ncbi:hypothetical protein QS257_20920 [Terrilactibacillus sp. S3-3]|nr:hypothetical protein QS257_20920 [Terrilactibacillus sp. S3-3]